MSEQIARFELYTVDLPFRVRFRHAAASRDHSQSVFLKCVTESGTLGFGECLPRPYVTGETQDGVFSLLRESILPRLVGRSFEGLDEVEDFLGQCDGRAPSDWVSPEVPQGAAWCAVDLALLDTFGRATGKQVMAGTPPLPTSFRYSGVMSGETGARETLLALAHRLMGFRAVKIKVGAQTSADALRSLGRFLGSGMEMRVDANMGWTLEQALDLMPRYAGSGVCSFEQPIAADDLAGLARLVRETGLDVMADESFTSRDTLEELIELGAATEINARISKCGGLVATRKRCQEAREAGLKIQIGCQVGESSLLSSAHLALTADCWPVRFAEGCFGRLLLHDDPGAPELRFARGGKPPRRPSGPGLGVSIDETILSRHTSHYALVDAGSAVAVAPQNPLVSEGRPS